MSVRVRTACVLVLLTRPERFWAPGARAPTPAVCERAQPDAVVAATMRLLQTACHPGRPASPTEVQAAQEKRPEPCRDVFFADLQLHRSAAALRHLLALVFLTVFADAATQMLFECRCALGGTGCSGTRCASPLSLTGGLVAHLPRPEIYRRGALSTPLSTDGRERARVIRGLNKFCPGQPPPADKDVLVPPLLKPLHDLPSSFGGGLAWLRLLDVAFRAPNLSS